MTREEYNKKLNELNKFRKIIDEQVEANEVFKTGINNQIQELKNQIYMNDKIIEDMKRKEKDMHSDLMFNLQGGLQ